MSPGILLSIKMYNREQVWEELGLRGAAKYRKNSVEPSQFITKCIIKSVSRFTNALIEPAIKWFWDSSEQSSKYPHFTLVDQIDIEAFSSILYLQPALRVNLLNREFFGIMNTLMIWSLLWCPKRESVALSRFMINQQELIAGPLKSLPIWGNTKLKNSFPLLAIAETLYHYRGCISFKHYNPSKPVKYGLLPRNLCDFRTITLIAVFACW